jgi:uncharacterized protein (UPF0333 family)
MVIPDDVSCAKLPKKIKLHSQTGFGYLFNLLAKVILKPGIMLNFDSLTKQMKLILLTIILFCILPFTFVKGQNNNSDSLLLQERAYYYHKYRSVRDTMTMNTWLNLKRISDNLEQVVNRDQQVIDALHNRIYADSALIDSLTNVAQQNNQLLKRNVMMAQTENSDGFPLIYLKAAVGILIFIILILIYFLISRFNKFKLYKNSSEHYEGIAEQRLHQVEQSDMELRKLKQRELDFREELERGMQSNQERLLSLQEKCGQLEKENQQLRESGEAVSATHLKNPKDISYISDLPENVEELKKIIASLFDERSSLMNLAGKLKSQFDDESRKNRDTIDRINNLLIDLSGKSQE